MKFHSPNNLSARSKELTAVTLAAAVAGAGAAAAKANVAIEKVGNKNIPTLANNSAQAGPAKFSRGNVLEVNKTSEVLSPRAFIKQFDTQLVGLLKDLRHNRHLKTYNAPAGTVHLVNGPLSEQPEVTIYYADVPSKKVRGHTDRLEIYTAKGYNVPVAVNLTYDLEDNTPTKYGFLHNTDTGVFSPHTEALWVTSDSPKNSYGTRYRVSDSRAKKELPFTKEYLDAPSETQAAFKAFIDSSHAVLKG